jgi:hypothetical protein
MNHSFDFGEFMKRLFKYLIEGVVVALVAYWLPSWGKNGSPDMKDIFMLATTAALTFALIDTFMPSLSASTRLGAGFGVGGNLVGF